ncbi:hypothetical protein Ssed_2533 [Shewanella sediminis HAW-EB3]|uniref:MazG-related protein n=1 Tax=Shewanella sediminis (strain HAW-EB3) TaxID=425104 RepID=A8FWB7_SHESH|nr:nucleotidyltransferase [Shewanella sediminis]ABV37140.1 hypothetical protein Ssed_2533 [Shewanella sediminis HAW-EB3]
MSYENAFHWIIDFLEQESVPYMIMGGLAAYAYGSERELYDVDLYIPQLALAAVADYGKGAKTFGPSRYKDEFWDIEGTQFVVDSVKVEITTDHNCRFFCEKDSMWIEQNIDFDSTVTKTLFGREVEVMRLDHLLSYKAQLARDVDLDDVCRLEEAIG